MIGLPCGREIMTLCEAVSIGYRNVTDRRTDGQTDERTDRQTDERTELLYQYRASVC